jgi:hypothetical protein
VALLILFTLTFCTLWTIGSRALFDKGIIFHQANEIPFGSASAEVAVPTCDLGRRGAQLWVLMKAEHTVLER